MPNTIFPLKPILRKRRTFNRNFTSFRQDKLDEIVRELQKSCQEMQQAIEELQELRFRSSSVDSDGLPTHGAMAELVDGQFLRLTQTAAAPNIVTVEHGLRRKPQAAIFIKATAHNQVLIAGSITSNIAPATETTVSFQLNGSSGNEHICILF